MKVRSNKEQLMTRSHRLISQPWQSVCHCSGMYDSNGTDTLAFIDGWFHCWQKQQDECRGIQEHDLWSDSAACIKTQWTTFHHSAGQGQGSTAYCQSSQTAVQGEDVGFPRLVESMTWSQSDWVALHFEEDPTTCKSWNPGGGVRGWNYLRKSTW